VLTEAARVVVIGAGIVGCGVADPLAQTGWREMLVVDVGPLFRTESARTWPISSPMWGCPAALPYSTYTALLAAQDDLFAERCTPRPGARHDIQTS
jgi:glycine/D-amino acid oxidase-like deaminating enzyme